MVEVKVYLEGGGDTERMKGACREAFSEFFRKSGLQGNMPRVVACGSRGQAMDRFRTAVQRDDVVSRSVLLVDSEDPVQGPCSGATALSHLDNRDNKDLRRVAAPEKCHLMVQVMETWFLADHGTLTTYFDQGFNANGLFQNNLEARAKRDVYRAIHNATQHTRKGPYGKGAHSFELLAKIDADKVRAQCPWADRLVTTVQELKQGLQPTKP